MIDEFGTSNCTQTDGRLPSQILGTPFYECSGRPDLKAGQRRFLRLTHDSAMWHY